MAGLYVHIPFCKSRCVYCDFYSTTRLDLRQQYVDAICHEIQRRGHEAVRIDTIYLGGGTPSQLTTEQLHLLFDALYIYNKVAADAEVTIECNPDDVTADFAECLKQLPVNRVSMGAQTFADERLCFLHRRHRSSQIASAVSLLRQQGISNISIDLMYGFPGETMDEWATDVQTALALGVEHLSAYALQYEEGTPLYAMLQRGQVCEVDEELSRRMYYHLVDRLAAAGYEHYEISNFALPGFRSRHNSSYWNQTPYTGLGAAAHSFDGQGRWWNVSDIQKYITGIERGEPCVERELLTPANRYNEMVMTALRTCEGLSLSALSDGHRSYCLRQARRFLEGGLLEQRDGRLLLTRDGLFVSDMVMTELMKV